MSHGDGPARGARRAGRAPADGDQGVGGCGTGACCGSILLRVLLNPSFARATYGNCRAERLVVLVDAVAERDVLRRRQQRARDHAELDVDRVVGEPAAVREPCHVAREDAEAVRVRRRCHAQVELERVGRGRVLADLRQTGHAGQQRLDDVGAVRLLDAEAEQRVQEARRLGVESELAEVLRVVRGGRAVELVLLADRDDHLVDQRVAEARDLDPLVTAMALVGRRTE